MKPALKICGMRERDNIRAVAALGPDILGFIFYPGSPRYAPGFLDPGLLSSLPPQIMKAGVFVNADYDQIMTSAEIYSLNIIQLHGNENPFFCGKIRNAGLKVIKVFQISSSADLDPCPDFVDSTDYFLFDSRTLKHGGSGEKFDWKILYSCIPSHPFFLSGGIGPEDAGNIRKFTHHSFHGADINSRFELKPGLKDIDSIRKFIDDLNKK